MKDKQNTCTFRCWCRCRLPKLHINLRFGCQTL